jgi:hypothetical protein
MNIFHNKFANFYDFPFVLTFKKKASICQNRCWLLIRYEAIYSAITANSAPEA